MTIHSCSCSTQNVEDFYQRQMSQENDHDEELCIRLLQCVEFCFCFV